MAHENLFKDGVTIIADQVHIGGDVVGRDKETTTALAPMAEAAAGAAFRLLVVVARPLDVAELPKIADQWELVRGLGQVEAPARIKILRPPTIDELRAELNGGYDAIHFDGHGDFGRVCTNCGAFIASRENQPAPPACPRCQASLDAAPGLGLLFFEKEDGTFDLLPAPELAKMITTVTGQPTKLVILSACRSGMGEAESLAQTLVDGGVPAVVGMKEVVTVGATLAFSRQFYAALGGGATIAEAVERARPALERIPNPNPDSTTPTHQLPALLGPGANDRLSPAGSPKGAVLLDADRLVGVPDAPDFFGLFIRGDPPQGRKGLLVQLARAMLRGERLIALTGTGGIGKTVLAGAGVRRLAWRFPGGVFYRSAADIADFRLDHLLDAFAAVFGQQFLTLPTPAKRDLVLYYLGDLRTPALVVVDNAETISDPAVMKFLGEMPAPSAAVIATRVAPEYGGFEIKVDAMAPEEGAGFFAAEVSQRIKNDPRWRRKLSDADRRRVLEICGLLDGHPLALLIAAALLRSTSLEGALALVKANPARGEVGRRFDFSYNPLPAEEKELLHRLAAFASHVANWAIQNICTNKQLTGDNILPNWQAALAELVRKSFVDMLEFSGEDEKGNEITINRYRLHPVMRQYVAGKAGPEAMRQHNLQSSNLLLSFARAFKEDFDALEGELPNLLGAMDWADGAWRVERGAWGEEAARVVMEMMWGLASPPSGGFLVIRGHWNEARRRLTQAAEAAKQIGNVEDEAAFMGNAAIVAQSQGDIAGARSGHERVKAIFEKAGRKDRVAVALHQLAMLAQATGDLPEARRLYDQSLQLARELGDKQGIAQTLHQLATLAQATGDLPEARRLYDQSLQLKRELGDKQGIAITLHQLATLAQATGDLPEARRLYDQSLQLARELGDKQGIAQSLHQLAMLAQDTGDLPEARRLYDQSLQLKRELGDKQGIAITLAQLALLEEQEGNLAAALSLIRQAEQLFTELGNPMREQARKVRERMEGKGSSASSVSTDTQRING